MPVLSTCLIAFLLVLPLLLTSSWLAEGVHFLCAFSALALLTLSASPHCVPFHALVVLA